jgi:hypothetical protein
MSPLERPVPPTGEEIHIPGPSVQPILVTVGITAALLGLTVHVGLVIIGLALTIIVIAAWIRGAVREYHHLPLEHQVATHDTVPRPQDRARPSAGEDQPR